jgi:hypothetical protein
MRQRKAQSILEYIIILSAIVAAVLYGAKQYLTPAVQQMFSDSAGVIQSKSGQFLSQAAGGGSQGFAGGDGG